MRQFKNILVGVDLSWGDRYVSEKLSEPNAEAVRQALWLAKLNSASVHFLFSLDLSVKVQQLIAESNTDEPTVLSEAAQQLEVLKSEARQQGIEAQSHVVVGESSINIIRQVLRQKHDLVIVGTRHLGAIQGLLLGSTGMTLLRKCPCAVWVTQSPFGKLFDHILVAHDLRPVGDLAMELGCAMAELQEAKLHVVHAAEYPDDPNAPASDEAEVKKLYRDKARAQIDAQLATANLSQAAQVNLSEEAPDVAILNSIEQHAVDLVVMGTVGRTGIPGLITGNTAERLLPQVDCSLLAVKPEDFESPVQLDED